MTQEIVERRAVIGAHGEAHRRCTRCVMDTSATDITFDDDGVCSYCSELIGRGGRPQENDSSRREQDLRALVNRIRSEGRGKDYDCIVGLSGGVDSSWAVVKAVELGLRPLAVHMDNGWDSELAAHNISTLITNLGVDLYTHVIDWDEYRELMQAFFDADVIDVELLYDNAMLAVNYDLARRQGVRYILSGSNTATEGMRMPPGWNWYKYDARNIRALARTRRVPMRTFPALGTLRWLWLSRVRGIRWVPFLDYFDYQKPRVLAELVERYGYKPYPYKHYESVFTRFYQGHLLPEKFAVDKRKLHLSSLIISGGLSREEAVADLERSPYPSEKALADDIQYFLKKMGWSREQLDEYLRRPPRSHMDFPSEQPLFERILEGRRRYQAVRTRRAGAA